MNHTYCTKCGFVWPPGWIKQEKTHNCGGRLASRPDTEWDLPVPTEPDEKQDAKDPARFYLRRGNEYGRRESAILNGICIQWSGSPPNDGFISQSEINSYTAISGAVAVKVGSALDMAERERFKAKTERQFYLADRNRDPYDNVWGRRGVMGERIYWGHGIPKSHFFDENIIFVVAKMEEGIVAIEVGSPEDKAEREAFAKREAEKESTAPVVAKPVEWEYDVTSEEYCNSIPKPPWNDPSWELVSATWVRDRMVFHWKRRKQCP